MKKGALLGLPVLMLFPLLIVMLGVGNASIESVNTCNDQTSTELETLGMIDGPVGGPVNGTLTVAQANIPNRVGMDGFRASMPRVLSTRPDFVALNEQAGRSLAQIEAAAPGYEAYRNSANTGDANSMANVVLFDRAVWTQENAGRVMIVEDDQGYYKGRPVVWDRFATWVLLQRKSDGAVVSVISVHHMLNPLKDTRQHGNPPLTRPQQYGAGMDTLIQLSNSLAAHGPVLIGGDMNTHASYTDLDWSAAAKMQAAGYGWQNNSVDFIFFPQHQGVRLERGWSGAMVSDHQWIAARVKMNGAGPIPTTPPSGTGPVTTGGATTATTTAGHDTQLPVTPLSHGGPDTDTPAGDVKAQLMRLNMGEESTTLTGEQAENTIKIAQVARDLEVPRFGLQIAIATAIGESGLRNLSGGDADSGGLFQQRPSQGWGTRAQVTDPTSSTQAFFGRAEHTSNPGLLDIAGWETMSLTEAAATVQQPRADLRSVYARWEGVAGDITTILGGDLLDVATTSTGLEKDCVGVSTACENPDGGYDLGPVTPQLTRLVSILAPMFGIETVGGYRASATDPRGHPAGLAADFMTSNRRQGDQLAAYARKHARALGVDYIIWYQRIWSIDQASQGWRPMRDRGSDTENHKDHVHINATPSPATGDTSSTADASEIVAGTAGECGPVVYPVPAIFQGSDNHNWHATGGNWGSWHTGTDFSVPCGTPIYAATAGTVQIDTTQAWAGPWLLEIVTGPDTVATWYAHMSKIAVSRGETVRAGQQIGEAGQEGNAAGCHLHFEVHTQNGSIYGPDNVDPSTWLAQNVAATPTESSR